MSRIRALLTYTGDVSFSCSFSLVHTWDTFTAVCGVLASFIRRAEVTFHVTTTLFVNLPYKYVLKQYWYEHKFSGILLRFQTDLQTDDYPPFTPRTVVILVKLLVFLACIVIWNVLLLLSLGFGSSAAHFGHTKAAFNHWSGGGLGERSVVYQLKMQDNKLWLMISFYRQHRFMPSSVVAAIVASQRNQIPAQSISARVIRRSIHKAW